MTGKKLNLVYFWHKIEVFHANIYLYWFHTGYFTESFLL